MSSNDHRNVKIQPTELPGKRGASSMTLSVGPGKYQAFLSPIPIYRQDAQTGAWEGIDASFYPVKGEEETLESTGAYLTVSCGLSGEKAFVTVRDEAGHVLSWGIEEARAVKPEPEREEIDEKLQEEDPALYLFLQAEANAQGTVRYPEIFPGVDLVCHHDSLFKDTFVFSAPEVVRPVVFRLEAEGLALREDGERKGAFTVYGRDGKPVFELPAPFLTDAQGENGAVSVSLEQTEDGTRLVCSPDSGLRGDGIRTVRHHTDCPFLVS